MAYVTVEQQRQDDIAAHEWSAFSRQPPDGPAAEGFQACRDASDGEVVRCRYDMGSREGKAWHRGWLFYTNHKGELET